MVSVFAGGMAANNATQLTYFVAGTNGQYIDLAGLLSKHNHRLYRQGMVYHVRVQVTNANTSGTRYIAVAQNNWAIRKAWGLAKDAWWNSTREERASGIKPGRWNDFKVFYEAAHNAGNTVGPTTALDGEWNYTLASAAEGTDDRQFQLYGASSAGAPGRWGILREYDNTLDTDTDTPPNATSSAPYATLQVELSSNQADNIQEEGDFPPYSAADLESDTGEIEYLMHSPTTGPEPWITNTQGFIPVPCGLIKLSNDVASNYSLRIDFKPGSYKGVHAEVMA